MSDGMIEWVASAMYESDEAWSRPPSWLEASDAQRQQYRRRAYAAIEAMRQPTEGMMRSVDNEAAMDIWHDMIEAALDG